MIIVDRHGKLRLIGDFVDYRCLIQVIFQDKRSRPKQQAEWLMRICDLLANRGVSTINFVGHSMGCITIFFGF